MSKPRKKIIRVRDGFRQQRPKIYLSPRFLARSVAKAKMRAAGVEKPNRKMRYGNWREWVLWEEPKKGYPRKAGRKAKALYGQKVG